MGVCFPACAAQRSSHLSQGTQLSVVLFLSLEWKPNFPPPLQNAAQAELLPTASTYRGLPNTLFGVSSLAADFFPRNFKIFLVAL